MLTDDTRLVYSFFNFPKKLHTLEKSHKRGCKILAIEWSKDYAIFIIFNQMFKNVSKLFFHLTFVITISYMKCFSEFLQRGECRSLIVISRFDLDLCGIPNRTAGLFKWKLKNYAHKLKCLKFGIKILKKKYWNKIWKKDIWPTINEKL